MIVRPVPTWEEGNPLYPLPPDYQDLTSAEGERQARVNGVRQWTLSLDDHARRLFDKPYMELGTADRRVCRHNKAVALVGSVKLFDDHYLTSEKDEEGIKTFDPYFYGTHHLATPNYHYQMIYDHGYNKAVAYTAPRGGAKTTNLKRLVLTKLISKPTHEVVYCTSKADISKRVGETLKYQLYNNTRIQDDWGPEYGGSVEPQRGEASMGATDFRLTNRAGFFATSAGAIQRGIRPQDYMLDDPEYDPDKSTDMEVLNEYMEELLFRIAIPMLTLPDTHILWSGTFVSVRHFLWYAMQNETVKIDGKEISQAVEKKFRRWKRVIVDGCTDTPEGRKSYWPELLPSNAEERERLGLTEETQTLDELEEMMGTPAFMAEIRAKPGAGGAAYFPELDEFKHGFWFERPDEMLEVAPTQSQADICWWRDKNLMRMPIRSFLETFPRILTADTSYTEKSTSDYKVANVLAITDVGEVFDLDMWSGQSDQTTLCDEIIRLAQMWYVSSVHPESVREGFGLVTELSERLAVLGRTAQAPDLSPFSPGVTPKPARISGLRWRFRDGKLKLPMRHRYDPKWVQLFQQVRDFDPRLPNGGLQKDDHLDTLSMIQYVLRGLPSGVSVPEPPKESALEQFREGKRLDETGYPLIYSLLGKLTLEDIAKALTPPAPLERKTVI